jgi:hypothetical protein
MTLNINIGDCVIIVVSSNNTSVSGGVTDNGSSGGNTYTQIGTILTAYGYESLWYCLSATHTATTVTANFGTPYVINGATFTGVTAIGASEVTATANSGNPTGSVTTTGFYSLVVGSILAANNITAVSGTQVAHTTTGTVRASFQTLQVANTGTPSAISGTITPGVWGVLAVELLSEVVTNQSSPVWTLSGTYWNTASATDSWTIQDAVGTGVNPTSTLTIAHTGSTGVAIVSVPNIALPSGGELAWNADTGISRLGAASLAIGNGTAGDFSGSLKLTTFTFASGTIAAF